MTDEELARLWRGRSRAQRIAMARRPPPPVVGRGTAWLLAVGAGLMGGLAVWGVVWLTQ